MRRSGVRTFALLVVGCLLASAAAASPGAESQGEPNCSFRVKAFFWTGTADRMQLAQALARSKSPCAEYWVSIPPLAANKKGLRVREDDAIRALGLHPVAELTTGEITGWANWVNEPGQNRTWFDAGVEFRRAMEQAGYDVTAGESWLINEFDRTTARDAPRQPPDHDWPPARRADMRELMRGLYQGASGMPKAPGIAEIGIHFRHQNLPTVNRYRLDMKRWLADAGFWADADRYLRWIAVESYPDSRLWAPVGSIASRPRAPLAGLRLPSPGARAERPGHGSNREELLRAKVPAARELGLACAWRRAVRLRHRPREHDPGRRADASLRVRAGVRDPPLRGRARTSRAGRAPWLLVAAVQPLDRRRGGMPRARSGLPPVPRPDRDSARRGDPRLRRGDVSPGRLPTAR